MGFKQRWVPREKQKFVLRDRERLPPLLVDPPRTLSKDEWPPNYQAVYAWRTQELERIRSDKTKKLLACAHHFYRTRPIKFINHWVDTYDPRKAESDLPAHVPFVLFKRQAQLIYFLHEALKAGQPCLIEKSRDMGATYAVAAFSVWLWQFWPTLSIGWGSYVIDKVDKIGDPDSIFEKIRMIIRRLPKEFKPRGIGEEHMTWKKIFNPETGSTITGESGDQIGRGGRKLLFVKDESGHYLHPELIEAALSDTANVQIDISSVNGIGNIFHRRRESGVDWVPGNPIVKGVNVFVMDWRDHPEKDEKWYASRRKRAEDEGLLHIFAQEVDRDYSAAVENVLIPSEWVKSAIDAHVILKFDDSGQWCAGLDVADGGGDKNALAKRKGSVLKSADQWGERDTGATTRRAVDGCRSLGPIWLQYDCIGVGSGVKAESNRLIAERLMPHEIHLVPWDASASPLDPNGRVVEYDRESPLNKDFYKNLKAQAWWKLRQRFERTWRARNDQTFTWKPEDLISISSNIPLLRQLEKELSQPTSSQTGDMKMVVNKTPEGTKSPNLADSIVMAFWPARAHTAVISRDAAARFSDAARRIAARRRHRFG